MPALSTASRALAKYSLYSASKTLANVTPTEKKTIA